MWAFPNAAQDNGDSTFTAASIAGAGAEADNERRGGHGARAFTSPESWRMIEDFFARHLHVEKPGEARHGGRDAEMDGLTSLDRRQAYCKWGRSDYTLGLTISTGEVCGF